MSKRLVCIGDSITEGIGDTKGCGWVGRINSKLSEDHQGAWHTVNLGVAGDTVIDVYHRLLTEVTYRKPDFLIIAAGLNDTTIRMWPDKGGAKVNQAYARDIWRQIFSFIKQIGWPCLVVGPYPVDEEKLPLRYMPYDEQDKGHFADRKSISNYNDMLRAETDKKAHSYIDMLHLLEDTNYISTLEDGLHPNAAGYDILWPLIYSVLSKQLNTL